MRMRASSTTASRPFCLRLADSSFHLSTQHSHSKPHVASPPHERSLGFLLFSFSTQAAGPSFFTILFLFDLSILRTSLLIDLG